MESVPAREQLLRFLNDWRGRLVAKSPKLSDEEFGQLLTINTIIWFIENH